MSDRLPELPSSAFRKEDGGDDADFYAPARLVTHIDEAATLALTAYYRATLPAGGVLLDLMSSWVSHLPPEVAFAKVIGQGMNAEELRTNPRLSRSFVQNLNRTPILPLEADSYDAALCCVGVQYLQRPSEVFAEILRVLRPGAPFIVSFSNRCFPTKAVAIWRSLDSNGHADLVRLYLERAGFRDISVEVLRDGSNSDPLIAITGRLEGAATAELLLCGESGYLDPPVTEAPEAQIEFSRIRVPLISEKRVLSPVGVS